jgi:hypothetical protein
MKKQEINKRNMYLKEDQDLIDRLNSVGVMSTGQVADQQKHEISSIKIEATLRSRKSMDDFDKSTSYFSKILGVFALIQIVIAIMQFSLDGLNSENKWLGFLFVLALAGLLSLIIKTVSKNLK